MKKTGVLLINQGTPDGPDTGSVRRYLRQFLSDPRVMDIPVLLRWFLLYFIILPFRPAHSSRLYQKIWTPSGSPLMIHARDLSQKVGEHLGENYIVRPAMRYGSVSIEKAIDSLIDSEVHKLIIFPLFPQYASSTTGSLLEEVFRVLRAKTNIPAVTTIPPFYNHPLYIESLARTALPYLEKPHDHVLFTFHGLPEKHILKSNQGKDHCLKKDDCCNRIHQQNQFCYRAHCYETARSLAKKLKIQEENYSVSFQSRMGKHPWIQPYTESILESMPEKGIKNLIVLCPSFIADCLETLEEIAIRGTEVFVSAGGESLSMVPALNSDAFWSQTVATIIHGEQEEVNNPQ